MEGGRPGRSVVLRGDIDGLPVQEDQARAVHSEVEGVMHACGHDVHVASLLGAASLLAARREDLPGRYVFLFQPAEEALCGAKAMLERGALTAMEGARLVGFHVTSQLPSGFVALRSGIAMSEANSLRITLTGPGGHGAMPSAQGDVIRATAELVSRLGEVASGLALRGDRLRVQRRHDPRRHGGQRRADLSPGHRARCAPSPRPSTRRPWSACRTCATASATTRASTWSWRCPSTPGPWSTTPRPPPLVEAEASVVLGPDQVFRMPPVAPSDDVSEFLRHLPGCYFFVGGGAADGSSGMHHSPTFLVEDESLRVGAGVLVRSALALAAP